MLDGIQDSKILVLKIGKATLRTSNQIVLKEASRENNDFNFMHMNKKPKENMNESSNSSNSDKPLKL